MLFDMLHLWLVVLSQPYLCCYAYVIDRAKECDRATTQETILPQMNDAT